MEIIRDIFTAAGVYTTIANVWRGYEVVKYGAPIPSTTDSITCFAMTVLVLVLFKLTI